MSECPFSLIRMDQFFIVFDRLSSEVEDYKLKKSRYETQIEELKALLTEAEERCKDVIDVRER